MVCTGDLSVHRTSHDNVLSSTRVTPFLFILYFGLIYLNQEVIVNKCRTSFCYYILSKISLLLSRLFIF